MSSVLICSSKFGGCGFVGFDRDWPETFSEDLEYFPCPKCGEDYMFQITRENIDSVTNDLNRKETYHLLDESELDEDLDILEKLRGC